MKQGYLSEYFSGVAAKRLSAVEADVLRSNQHEFNGVEGLRQLLGEPSGREAISARLIYLSDDDPDPIVEDATLTWYDARQKARIERNIERYEYRLYFPTTTVSVNFSPNDLLVIAKKNDGSLLVVVAEDGSTIASQLEWLFGLSELGRPGFSVRSELECDQDRVEFASRVILESIGVSVETTAENYLDEMLRLFGGNFPTTNEFSKYARGTLRIDCRDDPDAALMSWMDREEVLFRTLERYLIAERLSKGFGNKDVDVESFVSYSLSIQNRRKSRAGLALENHLESLFGDFGIRCSRSAITENRSKPDFLFPGIAEYRDVEFEGRRLTLLGVKSSCKDRWRQVLAEGERVDQKHLLTLEAPLSVSQTDEMRARRLTLVIPQQLHAAFTDTQRTSLLRVRDFTDLTLARQRSG